jgi:Tol biopolymer transport system component
MCLPLSAAIAFPFDFWTEIWFVEADGTNVRPLANAEGLPITYAGWPAWSPDGRQLAFYHANVERDGIAVVNADGSGLHTVAERSPVDWDLFLGGPDWSPDGKKIVLGGGKTWGFVDASGSTSALPSSPPFPLVSNWATWSWSRR